MGKKEDEGVGGGGGAMSVTDANNNRVKENKIIQK